CAPFLTGGVADAVSFRWDALLTVGSRHLPWSQTASQRWPSGIVRVHVGLLPPSLPPTPRTAFSKARHSERSSVDRPSTSLFRAGSTPFLMRGSSLSTRL